MFAANDSLHFVDGGRKGNYKRSTGVTIKLDRSFQLFGQRADQFQTQGTRVLDVEVSRNSDAIVPHGQRKSVITAGSQADFDLSLRFFLKRILQTIGYQFVDNQPARDRQGLINRPGSLRSLGVGGNPAVLLLTQHGQNSRRR